MQMSQDEITNMYTKHYSFFFNLSVVVFVKSLSILSNMRLSTSKIMGSCLLETEITDELYKCRSYLLVG